MLITLSSCRQTEFEKEIKDFVGSHIDLELDSMLYISNPQSPAFNIKQQKFSYIVYVDSLSCSDCAINHFADWASFENQVDPNRMTYLFIVSTKTKNKSHIIEKVKKDTLFNDRIYIDNTGIFEHSNPHLPSNKLLHTFLIDNSGQVVLVGSPINNQKTLNLALELLESD